MSYREEFRDVQREAIWTLPRIAGWTFVAIVFLFVIVMALNGFDLAVFKFWAPKVENAKREVFENTAGYVQGKVSYLTTLRFQYGSSTGDQRKALRLLILSEAATADNSKFPAELHVFIEQLKGE